MELVTSPIFTNGDLGEALATVARVAADVLHVDRVTVWRLCSDGEEAEQLWVFDKQKPEEARERVRLDLRLARHYRQALESGHAVVARAVLAEPRTRELATYWQRFVINSAIISPIRMRGQIVGMLSCEHHTVRNWCSEEITFATHIANLVAQAFLYAENQRHVREITLFSRITAATAAAEDLRSAMEQVCAELAHFFGAPQAAFALMNTERTAAHVIAEYRMPDRPSGLGEVIPVEGNPSMAYMLKHRRPLAIADAQHDPRLEPVRDLMRRRGTLSLLLIPFVIGQHVVGTLGVDMVVHHTFTEDEITLAGHVAAQVSQMLERLNLLANMRERTRQLSELASMGAALNRPLVVDQVVEAIGKGTIELTGADRAAVFMLDKDGEMKCSWTHNLPPSYPEIVLANLSHLPGAWVVAHARPFMVPDITQATNFPLLQTLAQQFDYRAIGILPLVYEGQTVGAISCYFQEPRVWAEDEVQILSAFARQAAIALRNAELFEAEQKQRAQLEALREASLQLTSSLNLSTVLQAIVQHASRLTGSDDAHIFLFDGQALRFGAAVWHGELQDVPLARPRSHGITNTVARTGKRIVIPDVNRHPLFQDWPWGGAIASFPLRSGAQVVGVMNVAFGTPHAFTEEELHLLELFADQAAIAIQNARLVHSLRERIQQLTVIARASTALRGAVDVEGCAATAAEHAAQLAHADVALLYLIDEERPQAIPVGTFGVPDGNRLQRLTLDNDIIGRVIRTQRPYRTKDICNDLCRTRRDFWREMGPGLHVPLRTDNGDVLGTIVVARRKDPDHFPPPFTESEEALLTTLAEITANALQRIRSHAELEEAYFQTVLALAKAMDARDTYTSDHSERIAELATAVARRLGFDEDMIHTIRLASQLHDIGKIGVPDAILRKPGPLTDEEWEVMKRHPEIGANIVAPVRKFREVAELILAHQERYDGSGYPRGLKGDEIPIGARILAVVDAYSAMTEDRVYRRALSKEEAIAELKRCSGTHFDPRIVEVFLSVLEAPLASADPTPSGPE
ncbi:MAG: GAF domain-containing protein [Ardenticatenia bacterium]|nr:GAF domain-containing protein [Ardenticatenia bacterium]